MKKAVIFILGVILIAIPDSCHPKHVATNLDNLDGGETGGVNKNAVRKLNCAKLWFFLAMMNGSIGVGILYLPGAVAKVGILGGVLLMVISAVTLYGSSILLARVSAVVNADGEIVEKYTSYREIIRRVTKRESICLSVEFFQMCFSFIPLIVIFIFGPVYISPILGFFGFSNHKDIIATLFMSIVLTPLLCFARKKTFSFILSAVGTVIAVLFMAPFVLVDWLFLEDPDPSSRFLEGDSLMYTMMNEEDQIELWCEFEWEKICQAFSSFVGAFYFLPMYLSSLKDNGDEKNHTNLKDNGDKKNHTDLEIEDNGDRENHTSLEVEANGDEKNHIGLEVEDNGDNKNHTSLKDNGDVKNRASLKDNGDVKNHTSLKDNGDVKNHTKTMRLDDVQPLILVVFVALFIIYSIVGLVGYVHFGRNVVDFLPWDTAPHLVGKVVVGVSVIVTYVPISLSLLSSFEEFFSGIIRIVRRRDKCENGSNNASTKLANENKEQTKLINENKGPVKPANENVEPTKSTNENVEPTKSTNENVEPTKSTNENKEQTKLINENKEQTKLINENKGPVKPANENKELAKSTNEENKPLKRTVSESLILVNLPAFVGHVLRRENGVFILIGFVTPICGSVLIFFVPAGVFIVLNINDGERLKANGYEILLACWSICVGVIYVIAGLCIAIFGALKLFSNPQSP